MWNVLWKISGMRHFTPSEAQNLKIRVPVCPLHNCYEMCHHPLDQPAQQHTGEGLVSNRRWNQKWKEVGSWVEQSLPACLCETETQKRLDNTLLWRHLNRWKPDTVGGFFWFRVHWLCRVRAHYKVQIAFKSFCIMILTLSTDTGTPKIHYKRLKQCRSKC